MLEQRVDALESSLSAFRQETGDRFDKVDARFDAIDARFDRLDESLNVRFNEVHQALISLASKIEGDHRQMLVLHEDLVHRISTIGERVPPRGRASRKKR